eukprot:5027752-Pyramimonas_sp.AAC.1
MGRGPHFQAALPSPGGVWHGGVGAVVQTGIYCKRFLRALPDGVENIGQGKRWFLLEMRTQQGTLALGVIHLVSGVGASG